MRDSRVRSSSSSSGTSAIGSNAFGFDGVWKPAARKSFCFFAEGVAWLPPDSDSISNKPRAFPSRCGVGPIAALSGDGAGTFWRCALGLNNLRNAEGETNSSIWWTALLRLLDGVAKSPLADFRGVATGCAESGPVGEACFRFLDWASVDACWFSRRFREDSSALSLPYSLYFAAESVARR